MRLEEICIDNKKYQVKIYKRTKSDFILRYQNGIIKISIPKRSTYKNALLLINKKLDWIKNQIEKESLICNKPKKILYLGQYYVLEEKNSFFSLCINGNSLKVERVEEVEKWFLEEAKRVINNRYNYIISHINLRAREIRIKKLKSAWGICYSNKKITLNSLLLGAPIKIIDYVIIHELCHLKHMNHSKEFWKLVENFCPDYKNIKLWLKKNSLVLHKNPNICEEI